MSTKGRLPAPAAAGRLRRGGCPPLPPPDEAMRVRVLRVRVLLLLLQLLLLLFVHAGVCCVASMDV